MPTTAEILQHGWTQHQSGNFDQAEDTYRKVLANDPRDADALVYLGILFFDQREFEQSVEAYREAIAIRSKYPIAWNNLGNSLRMLGHVDEAEECFVTSLEQKPGYLSALKNRGSLWIWSGEIGRGLHWYEQGLQANPNDAELHRNLGVIHLLMGNYDLGWNEYRWRWKMGGIYRPQASAPVWTGQPLDGKSILLYSEQGLGDAIHFIRVAASLKKLGATVLLQCSDRLLPLFSSAPGIDRFVLETTPLHSLGVRIDYHATFIEVVDLLYQKTGQIAWGTELFDEGSGYLTVSPELIDYWRKWLDEQAPKETSVTRRIGINWQGNPGHHADVYRSIPLEELQPLAQMPNVQLVNLQFGYGSEQLEGCSFGDSILRLPDHVDQDDGCFTDTTAILRNLDAVITTDTAVAHLAGAVGANTKILLGRVPDWRWGLEGPSTPWYPTIELIRQAELGDWSGAIRAATE
ncbi:MAG: tetratricopeptide repeat protein [Rubripirellula sp.]